MDACDNEGKTSVFYACQQGHLDMVRLLVSRGANLGARSHQGVCPLRAALLCGRLGVCEYLLGQAGRVDINNVDTDGRSMLFSLVQAGCQKVELIELLLRAGASVMTRGMRFFIRS